MKEYNPNSSWQKAEEQQEETAAESGRGLGRQNPQPTIQPTIRVALYDLRCVWQSPHACKLL
jgi:hypothetical protein